jgi:hypothetical protein
MHLGYKKGPGHDNMQHKKLRMFKSFLCVSCNEGLFLQHFVQNESLLPSLELVLFTPMPYAHNSCMWDVGV